MLPFWQNEPTQRPGALARQPSEALESSTALQASKAPLYRSTAELQDDLDAWLADYNEERPHQGRWCFGKTPMQTFLDAKLLAQEKMIAA